MVRSGDVSRSVVRSGDVALALRHSGDAARAPVVMIHGYPDTSAVWAPVMAALGADVHAVAYDVRGAGGSSAPRGRAAYDLARLADDFAAICDAVAGGRPVHVVGHDWGGIQGWEFATAPRFAGRIASFTSIAGPALGHAVAVARPGSSVTGALRSLVEARRSWYTIALCMPGGPTLAWRVALGGDRWRRFLIADGVPVDAEYPAPTLREDALHGANLYRQNIPPRLLARARPATAHAPVQLIVPTGDRVLTDSYYASAEAAAPGLLRRRIPGSHWAQRVHPERVAEWIAQFVAANEPG